MMMDWIDWTCRGKQITSKEALFRLLRELERRAVGPNLRLLEEEEKELISGLISL